MRPDQIFDQQAIRPKNNMQLGQMTKTFWDKMG